MFRPVIGGLGKGAMIIKGADALHEAQHRHHALPQRGFADRTVANGIHQLLPTVAGRAGHFEIKPSIHCFGRGVAAEPVGHDDAVIAPLLAQHGGEQPVMLGGEGAVEPIIGTHDAPGLALLDRHFKGQEIDFAQRPFVDLARHGRALDL